MNYYIFYTDSLHSVFYERICGSESRAKERIEELKTFHKEAVYTIDYLPENFYY